MYTPPLYVETAIGIVCQNGIGAHIQTLHFNTAVHTLRTLCVDTA